MKILYFTSTGNCLAVAKRFEAEYLSIPQLEKNGIYEIEDEEVGIIYPVYGISVPNIVKSYIEKCQIKADYLFVIATYGKTAGGTLFVMEKLLQKQFYLL